MEKPGPPPRGDQDLGHGIVAVIVVLLTLSVIVVALRFATRIWIVRKLGWDDWTILFALIGTTIGAGLDYVEVHYGFGRPAFYLTPAQLQEFMKYGYGEWIQTFATLMWTKVSICLFLLRIPTSKALIRPLQGAVAFLIMSNIILTLLWILQCSPVEGAWNTNITAKCFGRGQKERIIITQAIISAISDFTFASYPILILWKVQMKPKTKAALCFLMGLGVLTGICCIVRTVLNSQAVPKDFSYGGVTNFYWRSFEVTIGIVAACIPALRPGYKWSIKKVSTIRSSKKSSNPSDRSPLHEKPQKHRLGDPELALPPRAYSVDTGNTLSTEMGSEHNLPNDQIWKTTRVDVSQHLPIQGVRVRTDSEPPRPSLEIDLGRSFRVDPNRFHIDSDTGQHQVEDRF